MTERQKIVQHMTDNDVKFQTTVDMAIYLARDKQQTQPRLANESEYVDKVLKAGYKSKMAKDLFDDIQAAKKQTKAKTPDKSE